MKHLQLSLRYWALAAVVCLIMLTSLEVLFRREVIWQGPLGLGLTMPTDINTRGVWFSYRPPSPAERHVLLLGSSTALASMQLPDDGTSRMFSDATGRQTFEFRSLCVGGATFAEYLTLAENVLAHGYAPDLVIIYTGPLMFTADAAAKARRHTRYVPLVSGAWFEALERQDGAGLAERLHHRALAHFAVVRHRYYVNTWVHRRLARLLRREFQLVIPFDENRYRRARRGALEADAERFDRVSSITDRFRPDVASENGMVALLTFLREHNIRAVLVETPRSPPARRLYQPIAEAYSALLERSAREYGVTYVDPNEALYLDEDDFADLYHVSWKGRTRWLETVVPTLARLIG